MAPQLVAPRRDGQSLGVTHGGMGADSGTTEGSTGGGWSIATFREGGGFYPPSLGWAPGSAPRY